MNHRKHGQEMRKKPLIHERMLKTKLSHSAHKRLEKTCFVDDLFKEGENGKFFKRELSLRRPII